MKALRIMSFCLLAACATTPEPELREPFQLPENLRTVAVMPFCGEDLTAEEAGALSDRIVRAIENQNPALEVWGPERTGANYSAAAGEAAWRMLLEECAEGDAPEGATLTRIASAIAAQALVAAELFDTEQRTGAVGWERASTQVEVRMRVISPTRRIGWESVSGGATENPYHTVQEPPPPSEAAHEALDRMLPALPFRH